MKEWYPFMTEHEHEKCTVKRITDEMIEGIKKSIKKELKYQT